MTLTDRTDSAAAPQSDEDRVLALCDQLLAECPPEHTANVDFWGRQFDLGIAWVHFPEGNGGLGLSPKLQKVISERLRGAGAPRRAA